MCERVREGVRGGVRGCVRGVRGCEVVCEGV